MGGPQALMNFANSMAMGGAPFKNTTPKHSHMQPLPQAKNSTPLFPVSFFSEVFSISTIIYNCRRHQLQYLINKGFNC